MKLEDATELSPKRVSELQSIDEQSIDYSDIPSLDNDFWQQVELNTPKPAKQGIYIRLDAEALEWLRSKDKYQSIINQLVVAFYKKNKENSSEPSNR